MTTKLCEYQDYLSYSIRQYFSFFLKANVHDSKQGVAGSLLLLRTVVRNRVDIHRNNRSTLEYDS